MILRIHPLIVARRRFLLLPILLHLLLNHVVLSRPAVILFEPLCLIQLLHLVILFLDVSRLLLPLELHVLLDGLVVRVVNHPAISGRLGATLFQVVLVVLEDFKVRVHTRLGSALATSAGFLGDKARWVVADFFEHFNLFFAIQLPFKHIVARLFLLETFEQIFVFFCDPHHLSLSHVFI